jgi:hypothetical protein
VKWKYIFMQIDLQMIGNLLDAAKAMSGSDYKTAQIIKTNRQTLSHWRHGTAKMPVGDVVLVAHLAGLDPVEWGSRAIQSAYEGTEKGAALSEALKKVLVQTGEAPASTQSGEGVKGYFIRCINCIDTALQNALLIWEQTAVPLRYMAAP